MSKYGNKKVTIGGAVFDSAKEARRYEYLVFLQKAGEISELVLQPPFPFMINGKPVLIRSDGFPNGRKAKYVADFSYRDKNGVLHVEDVKGMDLPMSRLKRALVEAIYGIVVKII